MSTYNIADRPVVDIDVIEGDPHLIARSLGDALASTCELYRAPTYRGGLVENAEGAARVINKAAELAPIIVDHVDIRLFSDGRLAGRMLPTGKLQVLMNCEEFLTRFRAVDLVNSVRSYDHQWRLQRYGYNAGPDGHRTFLDASGTAVAPVDSLDRTNRFLDAMGFASQSDRTAAMAGRLTVALRQHWPGAKPLLLVTADKSQAGKDTTLQYMCGPTQKIAMTYEAGQHQDWANEKNLAALYKANAAAGVLAYENVRAGNSGVIASASIERLVTDPRPMLFTTGSGRPTPVWNHFVVAMTTNDGQLNSDLANRSLPCQLTVHGDPHARISPIGDPREYLREHMWQLHAETLGVVQRWIDAGMPLNTSVRHNMRAWAQQIGGMLMVSGFDGFLANWGVARALTDTERELVARLGLRAPGRWLRPEEWVRLAQQHQLTAVIPPGRRNGDLASQTAGMGIALTRRVAETLWTLTDEETICLRVDKRRPAEKGGKTCYRFDIVERRPLDAG